MRVCFFVIIGFQFGLSTSNLFAVSLCEVLLLLAGARQQLVHSLAV